MKLAASFFDEFGVSPKDWESGAIKKYQDFIKKITIWIFHDRSAIAICGGKNGVQHLRVFDDYYEEDIDIFN